MSKSKLIEQLKRKRFLSIGRAGMDSYAEPPGTEFEQANNFSAHVGGSAANIAVALAKLGSEVELVTCFSDDAVGRFTAKKLQEFGVGTSHCRIVGGEARNTLAVIETRLKDCQSVIYRNGAADFEMNSNDVKMIDYEGFGGVINPAQPSLMSHHVQPFLTLLNLLVPPMRPSLLTWITDPIHGHLLKKQK